ncbi:MAG: CoA-transferase subunit beta [Promethearchaeota archaeon]
MKYRRVELLVLMASKEIKNDEVVAIGQGIPMAAGAIAKKRHAPKSIILTEAGMVDIEAFQNLEDIADPGSSIGYSYQIDLFEVFTTIVNRGFCDVCMLGVAQMDRYGNVNSTIIGSYYNYGRKDIRLSGSGGANEFAGHSNRTVYTVVGGKFVEKLDYMTTPGYLTGGDSRKKVGLPGGPSAVISTQGIFRFHEESKEMYLAGIFPQTTIEQVQEKIPWKLKTAEDYGLDFEKITPPTKEDLEFIREFEPFLGLGGNDGRRLQAQVLPVYFERGVSNN